MTDTSEIEELLDIFDLFPDSEKAMMLGSALLNSDIPIGEKKEYIAHIFSISVTDSKIEAIMNLWAVGVMLEDDLGIVQKIEAVRGFLKDKELDIETINEWIRQVWNRNKAPKDMLEFIAIDLRNHEGIAEDLKKMLFEESSI